MGETKIYILCLLLSIVVLVTSAPFGASNDDDEDSVGFGGDDKTKEEPVLLDDTPSIFDDLLNVNTNQSEDAIYSADMDAVPSLLEGDIVINTELIETINLMKQATDDDDISTFDAINRGQWPNGVVPYTYAYGTQSRLQNAVNAAVKEYKDKTCIRWNYCSPGRCPRNHVVFFIGGGCYSMIGRQSSSQKISLGQGCASKGIAIHEMMHALGFFHEQSRRDRDRYITINWGNIPQRVRYNFEMYRPSQASTLGSAYDKQSIMHYGNYAFAINRSYKTITSRSNSNERLGQRYGLSKIDIEQLKKYYKCGDDGTGEEKENKNCKNEHEFCSSLTGWCKNSWVKTNCQKSCKLCSPTVVVPKDCKDGQANCPKWAATGYCKHSYTAYMVVNCKKSCGLC